MKEGGKVFERF